MLYKQGHCEDTAVWEGAVSWRSVTKIGQISLKLSSLDE